ncbi:hypothetical protein [Hymenobacter fastidiosus]|uniref:hypothetical protein n=1 Tax=Hymenobacter fastidiosus TaxID=486264 RepID=UPI0031EF2742
MRPPLPFAGFCACYRRDHQRRGPRVRHSIGTTLFLVAAVPAVVRRCPAGPVAGSVATCGFARIG